MHTIYIQDQLTVI